MARYWIIPANDGHLVDYSMRLTSLRELRDARRKEQKAARDRAERRKGGNDWKSRRGFGRHARDMRRPR